MESYLCSPFCGRNTFKSSPPTRVGMNISISRLSASYCRWRWDKDEKSVERSDVLYSWYAYYYRCLCCSRPYLTAPVLISLLDFYVFQKFFLYRHSCMSYYLFISSECWLWCFHPWYECRRVSCWMFWFFSWWDFRECCKWYIRNNEWYQAKSKRYCWTCDCFWGIVCCWYDCLGGYPVYKIFLRRWVS